VRPRGLWQASRMPAGITAGHVAGEERDHLPLCVDCLELLMDDASAFWEGLPTPEGVAVP
jgi:hypothetical protein